MTQSQAIEQELLNRAVLSYRDLEVRLRINHPSKPLKKAISELVARGFDIDRDGYPRINPNTCKEYKVWYIKS